MDSLARETPSYDLVELQVGALVRALAMVNETEQGYVFAGLAPAAASPDFATPAGRAAVLAQRGLVGQGRLVWSWVTGSQSSPFEPLIQGIDPQTGSVGYVGPTGRMNHIQLIEGLTALAP